MLPESLAIQCCTRKWTKPRQSSNVILYLLHRYTRRNKIFKLDIFGLNSTFKIKLCFHLANFESLTALQDASKEIEIIHTLESGIDIASGKFDKKNKCTNLCSKIEVFQVRNKTVAPGKNSKN